MKPVIYFICTKNRCRSLMAEGFAKHYFGDDFEFYSGGMMPREIPEETFIVMKERNVDIDDYFPKQLNDTLLKTAKLTVMMNQNNEDSYPYIADLFEVQQKWNIEDPVLFIGNKEETLNKYREARDIIEKKVLELKPLLDGLK